MIGVLQLMSNKNFHVIQKYNYTDGNVYILYIYNSKRFIYIGNESDFPPNIKPGFNPCITEAIHNDKNITNYLKKCAGPKHDFYGTHPDPSLILATFTSRVEFKVGYGKFSIQLVPVLKPTETRDPIVIRDVFNRIRVLGKT
jgi:hypothetical protein